MAPSLIPGKLMYALFLQEKHGYFDANAVDAAYWRRRFVSRFVKTLDDEIEILDLTEQSQRFNGFYMPFVTHEGAQSDGEEGFVLERATRLKNVFNELGLPSWSFNPDYPFYKQRKDNLRIDRDRNKLVIIDYESAVLTPSFDGYFDLDPVDFELVGDYIRNNKTHISDVLGEEETRFMRVCLDRCEHHTKLWHDGEKRGIQRFMSKKELKKTLEELTSAGVLTQEEGDNVQDSNNLTKYILGNLAVHLAIGFTVGLGTGPIPVGLFPRGAWTIGNRIYYTCKGNKEKAKVHSLPVLLWSSIPIPVINYFGYLYPLKKVNEQNNLVYGEHLIRVLKGKSLKEYLCSVGPIRRRLLKSALIPSNKRNFY